MAALPEFQVERGISVERLARPETVQEPQGVLVERTEDMLSVVQHLTGSGIRPRSGASPDALARFQNQHRDASLREGGRGGDSGEPGADHDDVRMGAHGVDHPLIG